MADGLSCCVVGCAKPVYIKRRRLCKWHYEQDRISRNPDAMRVKRAQQRAWYEAHRQMLIDRAAAWARANPEAARASKAAWREANPDKMSQARNAWLARNPEKMKAAQNAWARANPEAIVANVERRRARKMTAAEGDVGRAEIRQIKASFDFRCAYCFCQPTRLELDHVVPLARGGKHTVHNLVPACRTCNARKGTRTATEWINAD